MSPADPHSWRLPPIPWSETRRRIRADFLRLDSLLASRPDGFRATALHPSFLCVWLYRVANHWYRRGGRFAPRLIWQLNLMLTGADLSPAADLGEGLVIMNPPGTTVMGKAGRNLTVMPIGGIGGEVGRREDVGAGPGVPLLGDDVVLGPVGGAFGPVRIGDRAEIRLAYAGRDVAPDVRVASPEPRMLRRERKP